jgi:addiction module HigA family antidote
MLDSAVKLAGLVASPGNRFEKLSGDRSGQYKFRIKDQWRICFTWKNDGPHDVEIVDYHLRLTANALAKAIGVPPNPITAILKDERGITGDTAIRLGTFFETAAEFWMSLQMAYDLGNAENALPARVRKSIEENRSALA